MKFHNKKSAPVCALLKPLKRRDVLVEEKHEGDEANPRGRDEQEPLGPKPADDDSRQEGRKRDEALGADVHNAGNLAKLVLLDHRHEFGAGRDVDGGEQ